MKIQRFPSITWKENLKQRDQQNYKGFEVGIKPGYSRTREMSGLSEEQ